MIYLLLKEDRRQKCKQIFKHQFKEIDAILFGEREKGFCLCCTVIITVITLKQGKAFLHLHHMLRIQHRGMAANVHVVGVEEERCDLLIDAGMGWARDISSFNFDHGFSMKSVPLVSEVH